MLMLPKGRPAGTCLNLVFSCYQMIVPLGLLIFEIDAYATIGSSRWEYENLYHLLSLP